MRSEAQMIASRANWNIARLRSAVQLLRFLGRRGLAELVSVIEFDIMRARDHDLKVLKQKEEKNG